MLKRTFTVLVIFFSFLGANKCKKSSNTGSDQSNIPKINGVNASVDFFIYPEEIDNVRYVMHGSTPSNPSSPSTADSFNYSLPCKISNQEAPKDLLCFVEVAELDLFMRGIKLMHNVPKNMCEYFEVLFPWYYVFPVAYFTAQPGEDVLVKIGLNNTVSPPSVSTKNACSGDLKAYCPFDFSQWAPPAGRSIATESTRQQNTCIPAAIGGMSAPNCCLGDYVLENDIKNSTTDPTQNVKTTTNANWGGDIRSCLDGPAFIVEPPADNSPFPRSKVFYDIVAGYNDSITIDAPNAIGLKSLMYIANFFYSTNYNDPSTYPAAFNPLKNIAFLNNYNLPQQAGTQSPPLGGAFNVVDVLSQPFYEYRCLDAAYDTIARIRVMIRGWHRKADVGVASSYSPPVATDQARTPEPAPFSMFYIEDTRIWDMIFPNPNRQPDTQSYWQAGQGGNILIGFPAYNH